MKWRDKHITAASMDLGAFENVILYIGWDETGANIVRVSSCISEVRKALEDYAETLEEDKND